MLFIINNLAKVYFDVNKLETAKKYCLKALKLNKDDGNIQKILSLDLLTSTKLLRRLALFLIEDLIYLISLRKFFN